MLWFLHLKIMVWNHFYGSLTEIEIGAWRLTEKWNRLFRDRSSFPSFLSLHDSLFVEEVSWLLCFYLSCFHFSILRKTLEISIKLSCLTVKTENHFLCFVLFLNRSPTDISRPRVKKQAEDPDANCSLWSWTICPGSEAASETNWVQFVKQETRSAEQFFLKKNFYHEIWWIVAAVKQSQLHYLVILSQFPQVKPLGRKTVLS